MTIAEHIYVAKLEEELKRLKTIMGSMQQTMVAMHESIKILESMSLISEN